MHDRQDELRRYLTTPAPRLEYGRDSELVIATVPVNPGEFPISEQVGRQWQRQVQAQGGASSYGQHPHLNPERLRIRQRCLRLEGYDGRIELHADGSFVAAHWQRERTDVPILERHPRRPIAVDVEFLAVRVAALLHLAARSASDAGCSGDLLVGLRLASTTQHHTAQPMALVGMRDGQWLPLAGEEETAGAREGSLRESSSPWLGAVRAATQLRPFRRVVCGRPSVIADGRRMGSSAPRPEVADVESRADI